MIKKIYSLFAVIQLTSSLTVDIPLPTYEFARGGSGTLPCNFKPKNTVNPSIIITWGEHPDNTQESDITILTYYYFSSGTPSTDISDNFQGRASVMVDVVNGWANLTLTGLTSTDSKVFQCDVKIPGDTQGKPSDTTTVVVLVAPSKPNCAIQGTAEYYQNISLTCSSAEGTPTPAYKWQSYDFSNNPRANPPKATDVNGVLSLFNISTDNNGYYVCTSSNKVGSQSCNMTLNVMPPSMKLGSTAGIIGGCAAALLLLIVIICCCCYRKKRKSEHYVNGSPEDDEYRDKDPHELEELHENRLASKAEHEAYSDDRREQDDRQGRPDNSQYDADRYDDRRSDRNDDRRSDYDDRRRDRYDDRGSDYDDRRSDRNDDRRSDRYDDRRGDRDDRRNERYDDRSDRNDDRRSDRYDDRRSDARERYDDRRRDRYDDRRD